MFVNNIVINSRVHGALIQSNDNKFVNNLFIQTDSSLNPESIIRIQPDSSLKANDNKVINNQIETHADFKNIGIRITGNSNDNELINNKFDTLDTPISIENSQNNVIRGGRKPIHN